MSGEHGTVRQGLDKAQDAVGGMVGRAEAKTVGSHSANAFVENAAIGDLFEIESSRMALARSRDQKVRDAARRMIDDHTTNSHHLASALQMNETDGVSAPPSELDTRRRAMIDHLDKAPDDAFDKTYLDQQVLAHKESHDLFSGYAQSGDNAQLRLLARGTAPVIVRHLQHMETLKAAH